jgi:F5/8 type C domain
MLLNPVYNVGNIPDPGSLPHRYWRVFVNSNNGDAFTGILELEMHESLYGPNVCTGGTASASSAESGYPASSAFDSSLIDGWTANFSGWAGSTGTNQWIAYDFGAGNDKAIKAITITSRGGNTYFSGQAPNTFEIQWSNDGSTWTTYFSESGITWTTDPVQKFSHPSAISVHTGSPHGSHRYWRLHTLWADTAVSAGEVEMRGTPSGSDLATGGTATASSDFSGSFNAPKAFDNSFTTLWSAASSRVAAWLQYDFGSAVSLAEVTLRSRHDSLATGTARRASIRYADSTSGPWTTAWAPPAQGAWSLSETRTFTDPAYV